MPFPRGANWDGRGVNFSLFSESSESVELCLFDGPGKVERRIRIRERTNGAWHIYVPDIGPGQLYGYRVYGPYLPESGLRFNPNKLLLDPYAKAIGRQLQWADELFGYQLGDENADLSFDDRDSAPFAPLGAVIDSAFRLERGEAPVLSSARNPDLRGACARHDAAASGRAETFARHLCGHGLRAHHQASAKNGGHGARTDARALLCAGPAFGGTGTAQLLGVQHPGVLRAGDELRLHAAISRIEAVREFKGMVKILHNAGIEVILDVVYNHTAEGNHAGPTLSFRGIDNLAYYRTMPGDARHYMDYTGCGNTLNMVHPNSLQLLMDSLRYWVTEMHVDGFRFDLASALARELKDVDQLGAFFDTIYQDPTLAPVKLIAEPWDLGEGGYQVGNFPLGWMEWNGKYRDTVRKFWKGDMGLHSEIATRLAGSADLVRDHAPAAFGERQFRDGA